MTELPYYLAILPYTRNAKLFAALLTFLTLLSFSIWLLVFITTLVRLLLCSSAYQSLHTRYLKARTPE